MNEIVSRRSAVMGAASLAGAAAVASIAGASAAFASEIPENDEYVSPMTFSADGEVVYGEKAYEGMGGDKVYVVTGAARGMGKAIARRFLQKGHVVLFDILKDELLATRDEFEQLSCYSVTAINGDVRNREHVHMAREIAAGLGSLAAVANAAGINGLMGTAKEVIDTDYIGTVNVTEEFVEIAEPGSVCVCIGSNIGWESVAGDEALIDIYLNPHAEDFDERIREYDQDNPSSAYSYAKRGVAFWVRKKAREWGQKGARIMNIGPGLIDTVMGRWVWKEMLEYVAPYMDGELYAIPRWGSVEDIASMAEFLCSEKAAFTTGSTVFVEGGQNIPPDF